MSALALMQGVERRHRAVCQHGMMRPLASNAHGAAFLSTTPYALRASPSRGRSGPALAVVGDGRKAMVAASPEARAGVNFPRQDHRLARCWQAERVVDGEHGEGTHGPRPRTKSML